MLVDKIGSIFKMKHVPMFSSKYLYSHMNPTPVYETGVIFIYHSVIGELSRLTGPASYSLY